MRFLTGPLARGRATELASPVVERCTDCGRLYESLLDDGHEDTCPSCGGLLVPLRVMLAPLVRTVPTTGEELTGRLLGIGA